MCLRNNKNVKRDLYVSKETYKRDLYMWKRPICLSKPCKRESRTRRLSVCDTTRISKETYTCGKTPIQKNVSMWKETYLLKQNLLKRVTDLRAQCLRYNKNVERDLHMWKKPYKRDESIWKGTFLFDLRAECLRYNKNVKWDLKIWECPYKRDVSILKRDLFA